MGNDGEIYFGLNSFKTNACGGQQSPHGFRFPFPVVFYSKERKKKKEEVEFYEEINISMLWKAGSQMNARLIIGKGEWNVNVQVWICEQPSVRFLGRSAGGVRACRRKTRGHVACKSFFYIYI